MIRISYVYIITNNRNGTLYIGVTSDIEKRISQHKLQEGSEFTSKYGLGELVHLEEFSNIKDAIAREKALKKWNRNWKLKLIERTNPNWNDLSGPPPTRG